MAEAVETLPSNNRVAIVKCVNQIPSGCAELWLSLPYLRKYNAKAFSWHWLNLCDSIVPGSQATTVREAIVQPVITTFLAITIKKYFTCGQSIGLFQY